jgi:hypothetical protein
MKHVLSQSFITKTFLSFYKPKTKSPGVVLLSVREITPHHTGDVFNSGISRQSRMLTFGM